MANVYIQVPDEQAEAICSKIREKLHVADEIKSGEVSPWINKMMGVVFGFKCEKVV